MKYLFKLERPAKSSGGDRYEYGKKGDKLWMVFYIPQEISRPAGVPVMELEITIDEVPDER